MAEIVTSTRRGFLDFSPVKRDDVNKENDIPVLSLILFSKAPFVSFGTVKLGTSKSTVLRIENPTEDAEAEVIVEKVPSCKGFSVDHSTFRVQPQGSFSLTITWTPADEGGLRELVIFSANGVLRHQAVLLGRAEAPKKKKKSLWDTIKNKREGEMVAAPRRKKAEAPLKMAANKMFQVSRKQQYKRDKPRSPLASLNDGKAASERSLTEQRPAEEHPWKSPDNRPSNPKPRQPSLDKTDQENIRHAQKSLPLLLVPAANMMDNLSASPKPVNKDPSRVLNRTLSPIGTPERFKGLMPHIQSQSPAPASKSDRTSVPSLNDALTLINSDLSHINSSPEISRSGCDFSDSLESNSGIYDVLKELPNSPELFESNEPRLTFFVSKKVSVSEVVSESVEGDKKASFTSTTVIKGKAPVEPNSERKIKKSRRRLLEKTLQVTDGSRPSVSRAGTPSLPVIDLDTCDAKCRNSEASSSLSTDHPQVLEVTPPRLSSSPTPVTFPITSPRSSAPTTFFFLCASPPSVPDPTPFIPSLPSRPASSPQLHISSSCYGHGQAPTVCAPLSAQEESFPIHMVVNSKKRKSEEFSKWDAKVEGAEKSIKVKRSKVVTVKTEPMRSVQERRSVSQRQQLRAAGSVRSTTTSSLKSSRPAVPAHTKQLSSSLASRGASFSKLKSGAVSLKAAKVVAVAQSKLTFIKPAQTAIPRHPMPFAAKNMFYDERWIEKQERGFTWWLNYVLTPDDFKVNTEVANVNAVSLAMGRADFSVPKAPTKEEMSFSTYMARRKLNRLRRSACQLFTSEAMVKAIQRLELEVEAKRLLVRKDRHLWKDIGERSKVLNWLLSYNPLWLRIGLETIYGELISLESNSDALGLALFILQRLLWNPDIAAEFSHATVPHLYRNGHEEALSRFTLKKLLLLVCFLDKAKESRLIEHDPCLFCVDAEFKESKDLLLAFSRDFLSGEGILPRHLGYLGLPVSHVQTPLDEFSFAVKNLAVDLKCGIRLVRVMELLIQDWSLSSKLRLPAISRLQKVHNVDVALQVLRSKGVDLKDEHGSTIDSRDIVDGHREKTLSLLWKIIFAFHVEVILDKDQLWEEICFLKRTLKTKRRLVSLRADWGLQPSPVKSQAPYDHSSTKIILLMDWVRAVCDFYNLKVENFTVAFSDGRVLCYLIHHYHPSLLPQGSINASTTQTVECSQRGHLQLNCSASDSDGSFESPSVEFKQLVENEMSNLQLVNTAVSFLGGVPAMINPADMSNTIPNEKVVMSYLSFLCARLLDLRTETRAARLIQGTWRKYRLKKDLLLYKEQNMAAMKIQAVVRRFLWKHRTKRQNRAAVVIQAVWRGYAARDRLRLQKEARRVALQHKAATMIQAHWRMFSDLGAYRRLRYYTIVVQSQWRMRVAASAYGRIHWAAAVIQNRCRAQALARLDRENYLHLRTAVVTLQKGYRRWKAQNMERRNGAARVIQETFKKWYKRRMAARASAAVMIQSWYRMQRCVRQYRKVKRSAVLLQAWYRGHVQRRCFQTLKLQHCAATVIQAAFRGHAVRKQVAKVRCAAFTIQCWFRACVRRDMDRQTFVKMRRAAVTIQASYRGKVAREWLSKQHQAATVIQAAFRKHSAHSCYVVWRKAAVVIQQKYRSTVLARETKKDYDSLKKAALTVQAHWRGKADRERIEKQHWCAAVIQAHYRRHKAQTEYRSRKVAAIVVQRRYRAYVAGKEMRRAYLQTRAACVALQAGFRGMRVRTELRQKHQAATLIQSSLRMFLCRKRYVLLQCASIIVQCRYRALQLCRAQQNEYRALRQAAIKIQAVYRGVRVREDLRKRHDAARAIQAQFRMHRMRMAYLATKRAAIIIQERYRARKLRDQDLQRYKVAKAAAATIQAVYRGHRARRVIMEMHRAATVIQRKYRTFRDRNGFLSLRKAAVICQQRYRAMILGRKACLDYLSKRRAVVCLQAAYRAHKFRKQLLVQQVAALTIQAHFRRYRQRTYYKRFRWATMVIQWRYRANNIMREEMSTLKAKKSAAVVLQAAFRGMKSRQIIKQQHQAALIIQRAYKAHSERKQYLTLKSSVLTLQRMYRAHAAAKEQRKRYQNMCRAAVVLQAAFRGRQVRRDVARRHQAATVVQSAFRKHRDLMNFQAMRLAAIIIQRRFRSLVLQRRDREHFLTVQRSAMVLQAAFRGHHVRTNNVKMHRAATVIQANYRRHREQSSFRRQRWAACVVQHRFRAQRQMNIELKHYQEVKTAVLVLQAAYRGMKSRRNIQQRHQAAVVLQRAYRMHRVRREYLTLKSSVLNIQRRYRASVATKQQTEKYQQTRRAAIILQAAFRGWQVRTAVAGRHRAAAIVQSAFRKHRDLMNFQAMRLAAIIIQRRYRAHILQRQDRANFIKVRQSAVVLQAAFRGRQVRRDVARRHQAATVVQSAFRKHRDLMNFQAMRLAAIIIQRRFRSLVLQRRDREHFLTVRHSAMVLQAAFRGHRVRTNIAEMHRAATVIQANCRRHREQLSFRRQRWAACVLQHRFRAQRRMNIELQHYQEVRTAVVVLQAAYRGMKSRRNIQQRHQAASVIQRAYRAYSQHKQYLKLRLSVFAIQQKYRATVAAKAQRRQYLELRRKAVVLQAACRGWQVRREVACWHQAATLIQSVFRKHRVEVTFQAMRLAAVVIQRYYRSILLQRRERESFLRIKQSTTVLQAAFRGWQLRRDLRRRTQAAAAIQSYWRCFVQRRIFLNKREAVVTLQRWVRVVHLGRAERNSFTRLRQAVITLQTHYRAWIAKKQVLEAAGAEKRLRFTSAAFHHLNAMKIQRALRAHWALESAKRQIHSVVTIQRWLRAKQQRRLYLEDRRKVVNIQRTVRRWLARRHKAAATIQQATRKFLHLRHQERVRQGIVKAQALWRGHCSRRLNDNPKVVKLRHRLRQVSADVREEDKLCNKTSSALDYLLRYKQFSYILEALKNLDAATRLSPECCVRLVESDATNAIFTLIRCCNRSVPCMDVITFSIQILLNLSKYHKTIESVYLVENSVETLLDLLQRYREKAGDKVAERGGSIFTKACFLLALLLQDKHRTVEVTKIPKALDRIRSIYRLTARKHKMDAERTVIKQKMNASLNGSYFVPATPCKLRRASKFAPDWVLGKDKLRDIVDPLGAIQMVADTLSIVL